MGITEAGGGGLIGGEAGAIQTCQLGSEEDIWAVGINGHECVCWDVNDTIWVQKAEGGGIQRPRAHL